MRYVYRPASTTTHQNGPHEGIRHRKGSQARREEEGEAVGRRYCFISARNGRFQRFFSASYGRPAGIQSCSFECSFGRSQQPLQQRPPLPPRAMQARRLLPRPPLIASANAHLRPPFPVPMRHHRSRLILQGTCDVGTMPSAAASSRGTPTSKPTCSTTY